MGITALRIPGMYPPIAAIPGMNPPVAAVPGIGLDDDDDDVISEHSYAYGYDDYDSGNEHDPNQHENAWRRWVRPWERQVKAKKLTQAKLYAACKTMKINSVRHY